MDLDSLRCFVTAADTLNFRAAAKRVSLSPGAFSDRMKRLEEELGTRLFERTTRRTHLTSAGHRLLPHAKQLLEDADYCRTLAQADDHRAPFQLTLGTRFELGLSWLTPALPTLETARPERTLHLYMGDSPDLLRQIQAGTIDAAVTSTRIHQSSLRYANLHPEHYDFVGTFQDVRGPKDVSELTLVDINPDLPLFRYLLDALPEGKPWPFDKHQYLGGIAAIRLRLLQGRGVAVLPRYFIRTDLQTGRLRRFLPDVTLREDAFRLVWRDGHPRESELIELAEELRRLPLR